MIRLFRVSVPSSAIGLLLSETVLILTCYILAAYVSLDISSDIFLLQDGGWWRVALVALFVVLGLYFSGLYENYRIPSRIVLVQQFSLVLGIAFLLQALLSYGQSDLILPRRVMLYGSLLLLVAGPLWRILFTGAVRRATGAQRLLFVGASPPVREIIHTLRDRPELGMVPVGFLESEVAPQPLDGVPYLGGRDRLITAIAEHKPDRVVVNMPGHNGTLDAEPLLDARSAGIQFEDSAATYETVFRRVSVRELRPSKLVYSTEYSPRPSMITAQAFYSWILAVIGAIVTLPVMLVVALAVKLSSPGPVIHKLNHVGRDGAPFTLYKFRSAYADAASARGITPAGRWLRSLRLDLLPQLFNVIRGEMSLVGPRPERPEFAAALQETIPYYRQRFCVKPGILGWAQFHHRGGGPVDAATALEYDLYYIKNLAPSLDAYILFHTLLPGRGAPANPAHRP